MCFMHIIYATMLFKYKSMHEKRPKTSLNFHGYFFKYVCLLVAWVLKCLKKKEVVTLEYNILYPFEFPVLEFS